MNGLDLFSGIGGITKALDGYVRPVAYCENDRYCQGVLLSRMASGDLPIAPIWDDITTLNGSDLPPLDIIYGGFPCQDISVAGRGAGLAGQRSGLFFEIVRLAREIKPSFIFLENVPNIRTKGLGTVVKTLAEIGYDCRWGVLSASDVGANHKRERWFLLAHSNSERLEKYGIFRSNVPQRPSAPEPVSDSKKEIVAHANNGARRVQSKPRRENSAKFGVNGPSQLMVNSDSERHSPQPRPVETTDKAFVGPLRTGQGIFSESWWLVEPHVGRVANGVHFRVDRLRALGNSVVPTQAREAFERLMGVKK